MIWYLQTGDSGSYLASLAATLADELRTNFGEVLAQLEDLRLAEWADQAPPPPSRPRHGHQSPTSGHAFQPTAAGLRQGAPGLHTYANYPPKVLKVIIQMVFPFNTKQLTGPLLRFSLETVQLLSYSIPYHKPRPQGNDIST